MGWEAPRAAERLLHIGQVVRAERERRGLSRVVLAAKCGVAEGTVKNIELARHQTSTDVLDKVTRALGLNLRQLLEGDLPEPSPLNCLISPGLDPLAAVRELEDVLAAPGGGVVEQTALYLDHCSARGWQEVTRQPAYIFSRDSLPLPAVARKAAELGLGPIDLIGLGCGDGYKEVRLAQHLLAQRLDLRLFLLDVSHPLLAHAYRHAVSQLGPVSVFAQQGDFHDLPRYGHLLPGAGGPLRRRLLCMFGCTLGNLASELNFVQNTFAGYAPGDLLLLHVSRTRAPASDPAAVRRLDPRLAGPLPEVEQTWLLGLIERYGRHVGAPLPQVELETELDLSCCPVPGSYAIRHVARLSGRRVVLALVKRYEPGQLGEALRAIGWEPVGSWEEEHDALLLLRRAGA